MDLEKLRAVLLKVRMVVYHFLDLGSSAIQEVNRNLPEDNKWHYNRGYYVITSAGDYVILYGSVRAVIMEVFKRPGKVGLNENPITIAPTAYFQLDLSDEFQLTDKLMKHLFNRIDLKSFISKDTKHAL